MNRRINWIVMVVTVVTYFWNPFLWPAKCFAPQGRRSSSGTHGAMLHHNNEHINNEHSNNERHHGNEAVPHNVQEDGFEGHTEQGQGIDEAMILFRQQQTLVLLFLDMGLPWHDVAPLVFGMNWDEADLPGPPEGGVFWKPIMGCLHQSNERVVVWFSSEQWPNMLAAIAQCTDGSGLDAFIPLCGDRITIYPHTLWPNWYGPGYDEEVGPQGGCTSVHWPHPPSCAWGPICIQ